MIFLRNSWDITRQRVSNLDVIVNEMNKKFEVSERGVRDFDSCAPSGDASAFLCWSPGTVCPRIHFVVLMPCFLVCAYLNSKSLCASSLGVHPPISLHILSAYHDQLSPNYIQEPLSSCSRGNRVMPLQLHVSHEVRL